MEPVTTNHNPHAFDRVLKYAYVLNWEVIAYALILVLAVVTRFADLGTRVMSHDESLHTKFSWDLYRNGSFQHTPLMHGPLLFHMTAFFYLLFGDSDFTARIYPALIGVGVVMMPALFRRWLGRTGALLTALMFLASPLLMYYSRYIRHDLPAIFFALVMIYAVFQYMDGPQRVRGKGYWLVLLAAAMSLLLASKEVAFIYIAIFGSFLTLYWVIQLLQRFARLRGGRSAFYVVSTGMIVGVVAALAMIVLLSIIPPLDYDADGVANAADNCVNVANSVQLDDNGDGIGNDCQLEAGPALGARILIWTVGIFSALAVSLIATAQWVRRGEDRQFPWREIVIILLVGALTCGVFLVVEEITRDEPVTATPADPTAEEGVTTEETNVAPIALAWIVGVAVVAASVAGRAFGFWDELNKFPIFDVLIVMGTLILPWLTAFVIYATGAPPTDYSPAGITRAALAIVPFLAVSVVVGLSWNWRLWLPAAGVFMAIYAFFFTTMFTNGQGLASGMVGSLGYWLEQQGVRRGNQPQYYYLLIMTPIYEFLPLIGAIFAGYAGLAELWNFRRGRVQADEQAALEAELDAAEEVAAGQPSPTALPVDSDLEDSPQRRQNPLDLLPAGDRLRHVPFVLFVGYWAVFNLYAYTLSGEKMPWLETHLTVPLAMLAGWYGGRVIERIRRESFRAAGWPLLALVPLAILAIGRIFGAFFFGRYPFQGTSKLQLEQTMVWLAALLVAGGAGYAIARIWQRIGWRQVARLTVTVFGSVLLLLTFRAAFMASFVNYDLATEYLVYAHAGPAHTTVFNMMRDISQRMTGGMDLRVAYDFKMSWPGSWYFREYPNAVYFDRNPSVQVLDEAIVVVTGSESRGQVEPLLADRYYHYEYVRMWWPMQDYFNLTAKRLDNVFDFSPNNPNAALLRSGLWDIWWNRDYTRYGQATGGNFTLTQWPVSDRMHVYVRKDVAAQIWDMGVGAEVVSEFETSLSDLWTQRSAAFVWGQEGEAPGQLNHPRGLAAGLDGTLYVADSLNHRIQAFNPNGELVNAWGTFEVGERGTAAGGNFNQPWGIAVGPEGNVYVA
ncbi:MAG: TIGR03663 family protein, partial [Anaerolineae bacterium]|nr:TIGR03663 family protein [Anaerolineae bacterium]